MHLFIKPLATGKQRLKDAVAEKVKIQSMVKVVFVFKTGVEVRELRITSTQLGYYK